MSVEYIWPKSRTERPKKTKISTEVAHRRSVTRDLDITFKVKGQLAGGGGILWRPPTQLVTFTDCTCRGLFRNCRDIMSSAAVHLHFLHVDGRYSW